MQFQITYTNSGESLVHFSISMTSVSSMLTEGGGVHLWTEKGNTFWNACTKRVSFWLPSSVCLGRHWLTSFRLSPLHFWYLDGGEGPGNEGGVLMFVKIDNFDFWPCVSLIVLLVRLKSAVHLLPKCKDHGVYVGSKCPQVCVNCRYEKWCCVWVWVSVV